MHTNNINLASLDLNLLAVLHALLTTQSVSEAAGVIGRTQPATSHALKRLRLHFGDPLLVRDGWRMQLTPLGNSLRTPVADAVDQIRIVFDRGEPFDPISSTRKLKIATPDLCVPLFAPLLSHLNTRAPNMTIEFCSPTDYRRAITASEADLALGFGRFPGSPSLVCRDAQLLTWTVFTPETHPYTSRRTLREWSRAKHIVVAGKGTSQGPIEKILAAKKIDRQVAVVAPTFQSALILAQQCNALLTTLMEPFQPYADALGLKAIKPPFTVPAAPATLVHREPYTNPFEQWLANIVSQYL